MTTSHQKTVAETTPETSCIKYITSGSGQYPTQYLYTDQTLSHTFRGSKTIVSYYTLFIVFLLPVCSTQIRTFCFAFTKAADSQSVLGY